MSVETIIDGMEQLINVDFEDEIRNVDWISDQNELSTFTETQRSKADREYFEKSYASHGGLAVYPISEGEKLIDFEYTLPFVSSGETLRQTYEKFNLVVPRSFLPHEKDQSKRTAEAYFYLHEEFNKREKNLINLNCAVGVEPSQRVFLNILTRKNNHFIFSNGLIKLFVSAIFDIFQTAYTIGNNYLPNFKYHIDNNGNRFNIKSRVFAYYEKEEFKSQNWGLMNILENLYSVSIEYETPDKFHKAYKDALESMIDHKGTIDGSSIRKLGELKLGKNYESYIFPLVKSTDFDMTPMQSESETVICEDLESLISKFSEDHDQKESTRKKIYTSNKPSTNIKVPIIRNSKDRRMRSIGKVDIEIRNRTKSYLQFIKAREQYEIEVANYILQPQDLEDGMNKCDVRVINNIRADSIRAKYRTKKEQVAYVAYSARHNY